MAEYDVKYYLTYPSGHVNMSTQHTRTIEADNYAEAMRAVMLQLLAEFEHRFVVVSAKHVPEPENRGYQIYADDEAL